MEDILQRLAGSSPESFHEDIVHEELRDKAPFLVELWRYFQYGVQYYPDSGILDLHIRAPRDENAFGMIKPLLEMIARKHRLDIPHFIPEESEPFIFVFRCY